jgi:hypothetical protein
MAELRIGFVILSHRHPGLIKRLADVLAASPSTAGVAVHYDRQAGPLQVAFEHPEKVRVVAGPRRVPWGDWGFVGAVVKGLQLLDEQYPAHDWAVVLSGQDYPTRPIGELAAFLASSGAQAHIYCQPAVETWGEGQVKFRYGYDYWALPARAPAGTLLKVAERLPGLRAARADYAGRNLIGVRTWRPLSDLWGGSDWIMVDRDAQRKLLDAYGDAKTARRYRRAILPSEVFFATTLYAAGFTLAHTPHRYVHFAKGSPHPDVLTERSLPDIDAHGHFFARKMDPADSAVLMDALDQRLRPAAPG